MCKSVCEAVLAVIILVFALWPEIVGAMTSKWIIVIAAIVLLVHSFTCKKCFGEMPMQAAKGRRR
jgi:hypothetical protein